MVEPEGVALASYIGGLAEEVVVREEERIAYHNAGLKEGMAATEGNAEEALMMSETLGSYSSCERTGGARQRKTGVAAAKKKMPPCKAIYRRGSSSSCYLSFSSCRIKRWRRRYPWHLLLSSSYCSSSPHEAATAAMERVADALDVACVASVLPCSNVAPPSNLGDPRRSYSSYVLFQDSRLPPPPSPETSRGSSLCRVAAEAAPLAGMMAVGNSAFQRSHLFLPHSAEAFVSSSWAAAAPWSEESAAADSAEISILENGSAG